MFHDQIVEEIHKIREQYSRSFNHDLKAIFADLQKQQAESGREVVSLSRKQDIRIRWSGQRRLVVMRPMLSATQLSHYIEALRRNRS